jgi:cysteine synthase A
MLPDTGERYLSTPLFEDIKEEMSAAELALSRSTPLCRFDVPAPPVLAATPSSTLASAVDVDAATFVDEVVGREPVVLFALEWCEFCWSVRKFFARLGIAYHSVDLDSVKYQRNDLGGKIRAVLAQRTGTPFIPKIFVGGHHIGGSTELFDAWRSGALQKYLADCGVTYDQSASIDPTALLPKWLHPRKIG